MCEADNAACTLNCKVSCTCTRDENGADLFVGLDCSIPAAELVSVKEENRIMLNALTAARNQIVGDPDCDFYERMNNNLLNVIHDPSLLPDALVDPTFENVLTSVKTPTYQECLQEERLAESLQEVTIRVRVKFRVRFRFRVSVRVRVRVTFIVSVKVRVRGRQEVGVQ